LIITDDGIISTLKNTSKFKLEVICDYCNCKYNIEYRRHITKDFSTGFDYCKKCIKIKNKHKSMIYFNICNEELLDIVKNKGDISGIYGITNINNNKIYIGSSKNIIKRLHSHMQEIKEGIHHCKEFNKLKVDDFKFEIIKYSTDIVNLIDLEYSYIRKRKSYLESKGYNKFKSKTNRKSKREKYQRIDNPKDIKGSNNPCSKLCEKDVLEIVEMLNSGIYTKQFIADKYNVSRANIYLISTGKKWSNFTGINKLK